MKYEIVFTKQAEKDFKKIITSSLKNKIGVLLETLETNPKQPPYEKLVDKENTFSKRINLQHRLVYQIIETENVVKIIRMWTHYGDN